MTTIYSLLWIFRNEGSGATLIVFSGYTFYTFYSIKKIFFSSVELSKCTLCYERQSSPAFSGRTCADTPGRLSGLHLLTRNVFSHDTKHLRFFNRLMKYTHLVSLFEISFAFGFTRSTECLPFPSRIIVKTDVFFIVCLNYFCSQHALTLAQDCICDVYKSCHIQSNIIEQNRNAWAVLCFIDRKLKLPITDMSFIDRLLNTFRFYQTGKKGL